MKILIYILTFAIGLSHASAEQVKIGAIFPLSGTVAPWGEKLRAGLQAVNAVNNDNFKIVFEDEGPCVAKDALSAYKKLRAKESPKIIFLGCLSGVEAIAPVAKRDDVLLLSLGLLNENTLNSGAMLIDLATEIGIEGKYLADYIEKEHPKKIAGLFFADAFGSEFSKVLTRNLEKKGSLIVDSQDASADIASFKSNILRWKAQNIDLLVTSLSNRQQSILYKEMYELGFKPLIYSTYALESYAPPKAERIYFEGIRYTHPVNNAPQSDEAQKLRIELDRLEGVTRSENVNSLFAYDGVKFLNKGILECQGVKPNCLYAFFKNLGYQTGISGEMRFQSSGALTRPYGLKTVKDGEFVWLEKTNLNSGG